MQENYTYYPQFQNYPYAEQGNLPPNYYDLEDGINPTTTYTPPQDYEIHNPPLYQQPINQYQNITQTHIFNLDFHPPQNNIPGNYQDQNLYNGHGYEHFEQQYESRSPEYEEINQQQVIQDNFNNQQNLTIPNKYFCQQQSQDNTLQTQQRNPNAVENYQKQIETTTYCQNLTTQDAYQLQQGKIQKENTQQINEVIVVEKESSVKNQKKNERKPSNQIYAQLKDEKDETKNLLRNYGDQLRSQFKQMVLKKEKSFWIETILDNYIEDKKLENQQEFRDSFIKRYQNFGFSNFQKVREEWTVSRNDENYHLKNAYRLVCFHYFTKQPLRYIYKSTNKINKRNQRFTHLYYLKVFIQGIIDPTKFQKFKDSNISNNKSNQNLERTNNNQE